MGKKEKARMSRQEQVRFLSAVVEQSSEGIAVADLEGSLLFVNHAFAAMHGYTPAELDGEHLSIFHTPAQMPAVDAANQQLKETGEFSGEIGHARRDGTEFPTLMHNSLLRDETGNPIGMIGTLRDITELKQARDLTRIQRDLGLALGAARSLDEVLRLCVEAAIQASGMDCGGVYLIDEISGCLDLAFHTGLPPDFVTSVSHYEADSANARLVMAGQPIYTRHQEASLPLDQVRRREGLRAIAILPVRYEGQIIACFNIASHTLDEVPDFARTALEAIATQIGSAITRARAVETLRQNEAKLQSTFRAAPTGIGLVSNRVLLEVNDQLCHMVGYTSDELVGQSIRILYPTDEEFEHVGQEKYAQIREQGWGTVETRFQRKDGQIIDVLLSSAPFDLTDLSVGVTFTVLDITERKQVEEALRASEDKFRNIIESTPMGMHMYELEPDGRLVFTGANPAADTILGVDNDQFVGQTIEEAFPALAETEVPARYRLAASEGQPWHTDQIVYEENQIAGAFAVHAFQTSPGRMVAAFLDITERKRAEAEVLRRATQQEALNAVIAAATTAPDLPGLLESALEHTLRALGLEKGAIWVSGQRVVWGFPLEIGSLMFQTAQATDLRLPDSHIVEDWQNAVHGDSPITPMMTRFGIRASLTVPILTERRRIGGLSLATTEPRLWPAEEVALVEAIGQQIGATAERLRLLEVTREQARRVQQIMDTVPDGVLLLDTDLRVLLTNPAAQGYLTSLSNVEEGDVLSDLGGWPMKLLLAPPLSGMPYHEITVTGPPRRVFEVQARSMEDEPETSGWVLLVRDATAEREAERRIQQQERLAAVGQLAAGIAHDFNNFLTGIIGLAQLLQMRGDVPESAKTDLARIVREGRRAAHLIRQILDFSRKSISELQHLDLLTLLKEVTKLLQRTIPENIHIALEFAPGEYWINADPTQIQQVLTNLAVNARDAMPEGGELRLRLSRLTIQPEDPTPDPGMQPGEWVVLSVKDQGGGIPPTVLPHIFEPFFTTKEVGEGTGLGLAQVYGIVRQHGGYICVTSQAEEGTVFTIYLPATQIGEELAPDFLTQAPNGQGETILLVEDEETVLGVIQTQLDRLGYRVLTATNGREALEIYRQHLDEIHLVLMDLVMPKMDGMVLFQELRAQNPHVKVIAMTGYPLGGKYEQLLAHEAVDWIQKPMEHTQLAQILRQALG